MSSISSLLATAVAAIMPFAGSTGPVDAQDQLSQPDPAKTGQQSAPDQQPGAHAENGRITGYKEMSSMVGLQKALKKSILVSMVATCKAASWLCNASWH
ncbi:hypothetical protein [Corynebacterium sp. p3-SID1241]|uniref:hypothetical protein n=1 Tax=Corynebacterium sp. p3-SID1241 TaxID=2916102 RepID=UPI0021A894BF|nr:hypothetical protein [Corynebacterium sp. p3-SID1241]MCT1427126.1 hypothetical protein [Corynebacterium sp. p3-SID1241]